jgi:hypothetical protein
VCCGAKAFSLGGGSRRTGAAAGARALHGHSDTEEHTTDIGEWSLSAAIGDKCSRSIHCLTCSVLLSPLCALGSHLSHHTIVYPLDPTHTTGEEAALESPVQAGSSSNTNPVARNGGQSASDQEVSRLQVQ